MIETSAQIPELTILEDDGSNIFTKQERYEIPLYQRPYAWREEHINQLIEDINDIPDEGDQKYYLGSLIVYPKDRAIYEVIDGQQRLTTLYLLLSALDIDVGESKLSFSCRKKSDFTLGHLQDLKEGTYKDEKMREPGIEEGMRVVLHKLETYIKEKDREKFKEKLTRTCLYRIEVPRQTDLNHYFEIMNTRGEQLEQHEVLKAWLMEPLSGNEANCFAGIWEACSNMSCHVQTRFEPELRGQLFGWGYNEFPWSECIKQANWGQNGHSESLDIRTIVNDRNANERHAQDEDEFARFESIIDFRFFLLHTLKVFVDIHGIVGPSEDDSFIPKLLDDKKLSATFKNVVEKGRWDGKPIDKARFSHEFAFCLLQTRFLFDKCIIKREFKVGDLEGEWSLKELYRDEKKKCRYRSTKFKRSKYQQTKTLERVAHNVLMMQSCLRVSYTSPKVMHWITLLLTKLMEDPQRAFSQEFVGIVEECARDSVRSYLNDGDYELGINTPHVVLNYLDYLLWKNSRLGSSGKPFVFEFRTSIEHWYPQNPSDDTFVRWNEVDRLGNLCLVQRNINSKFSNLNPLAKAATFQEMIEKGSLKLREMADLTKDVNGWKDGVCQQHEEEMLRLLKEDCGLHDQND